MKPRWYDGYGLKGLKVFFLLLVQSLPPFTDDSQVIRGEFGFECACKKTSVCRDMCSAALPLHPPLAL